MRFTFKNCGKNGHLFIENGEVVSSRVECDKQLSTLQDYICPSKLITVNEIEKSLLKFGFSNIEFIANEFASTIDCALNEANFYGSINIMHKEKLILRKGYGFKNIAKEQDNTSKTYFHCDGLGEIVSSLVAYTLEDDGLISQNDRLDQFFPAYCVRWPHLKTISIEMLLSQTSGFAEIADRSSPITSLIPTPIILESIFRKPLLFTPNEFTQSSRANPIILAAIIEQVTNKPYWKSVERFGFKEVSLRNREETATQYDMNGRVKKRAHPCFQKGHDDTISTSFGMLEVLEKVAPYLHHRKCVQRFAKNEVVNIASGLTCDFLFGKRIFSRIENEAIVYSSPKDGLRFCMLANKPMTEDLTLKKLISLITTNQF